MHNAMAYHPLTGAQPVSKKQLAPPAKLSPVHTLAYILCCGISLWQVQVRHPDCNPSQILVHLLNSRV